MLNFRNKFIIIFALMLPLFVFTDLFLPMVIGYRLFFRIYPLIALLTITPFILYTYRGYLWYKKPLRQKVFGDLSCSEYIVLIRFLDRLLTKPNSVAGTISTCGVKLSNAIQKLEPIDQVSWRGVREVIRLLSLDLSDLKKCSKETKHRVYAKFLSALIFSLFAISFLWFYLVSGITPAFFAFWFLMIIVPPLIILVGMIPLRVAARVDVKSVEEKLNIKIAEHYEFREFVEKLVERLLALATKCSTMPIYLVLSQRYRSARVHVVFGIPIHVIEPSGRPAKLEPIDVDGYLERLRGHSDAHL